MKSEPSHAERTSRSRASGGEGRVAATETSAANLLDTLSEVVFRTDADGRWIYLNRAWTRLTGFEVGPSLGARFLDYVHPDEIEYTVALFMGVVRGGADHCHHETRYRTRDGGYRQVQIRANVLRDPSGEVLGNTGTIIDVTDSRLGAEAVGEHAALLELVSAGTDPDELPLGVAVYDRDLRLRRESPVVDRLVGVPQRPGDSLERLVALLRPRPWRPRSLGGEWGLVPVALRTGRAQLGDLELAGERGPVRSLRASAIPFHRDGEDLVALVLSDITDLRRAERQQAGLARLGQRALADRDIPTLLTEAADLVASTLDVAVVDIIRREPDAQRPGPRAAAGGAPAGPTGAPELTDPAEPVYVGGPLAGETTSLVGLALDVDTPVVANDLAARPHLTAGWSDGSGAAAALAARIGPTRSPFGVLAVGSALPRRFTGEEARFVQSVAHVLGAAIDRDRAERRSRQLYEEAERGRAWLAASAEITAGALVVDQPRHAFLRVATLARAVTSADVGAVALPDEAGNLVPTEVDSAPHRHADPETLHGLALALEAAENLEEFRAGRPVHVDGLDAADPRTVPDPDPADPRLCEALVIPLAAADMPLGALVLANSGGTASFASNDPDLAAAFGNDAALAIQLAEAHRERARLAVVEDRERIARDLHDLVIQRLFAIGLHLQSLTRAVGDVTAARLNAAINGLDSTIDEIRRTIFRLQPTVRA